MCRKAAVSHPSKSSNGEACTAEAIYLALLVNEPTFTDVHPERQLEVCELRRVLTNLPFESWLPVVHKAERKRPLSVYLWARSLALYELQHFSELGRSSEV